MKDKLTTGLHLQSHEEKKSYKKKLWHASSCEKCAIIQMSESRMRRWRCQKKGSHFLVLNDDQQDSSSEEDKKPNYNAL